MTKQIISALTRNSNSSELDSKFFSEYELNQNDLQINVEEIGQIKFPIDQETINKIIKVSEDAKFGLREKTLLDKNIRDTKEIPTERLHIKYNEGVFTKLLNKAKIVLGLSEEAKLTASLHNMLIYGQDQFFKTHQDSEKLEGMVATLVLVLPSPHIGGDLVIKHSDTKHNFTSEQLNSDKIKTIAFYADCQHEVKKIKQGYRIVLTYNVVLEVPKDQIEKSRNFELEAALKDYFFNEKISSEATSKLVYFLDHSYSQHSLRWNMLKGDDRINALAFKASAKILDLIPHLALVEIHETWTEEDDYGRYDGELIDDETHLSYWLDENNNKLPYKEIPVAKDESCWTVDTSELKPDEEEHEGYMGNYGNTVDYWYRRAAVVLWRKSDQIAMNFDLNYDNAIQDLETLCQTPGNELQVIDIIKSARESIHQYSKHNFLKTFTSIACYINDKNIANSLLSYFELNSVEIDNVQTLVNLQHYYGVDWIVQLMKNWIIKEKSSNYYRRNTLKKNIYGLVSHLLELGGDHRLGEIFLDYQFIALEADDKSHLNSSPVSLKNQQTLRITTAKDLLDTAKLFSDEQKTTNIINYLISIPKLYPVIELATILIHNLDKQTHKNSYITLQDYITKELSQELDKDLRSSDDWSIEIKLPCSCEYCKIANEFLQSRTESNKIWPIVQDYRTHIINRFEGLGLPVDLSVQKVGSPHKLVMTKTEKLYKEAKERFDRATDYYHQLEKMV